MEGRPDKASPQAAFTSALGGLIGQQCSHVGVSVGSSGILDFGEPWIRVHTNPRSSDYANRSAEFVLLVECWQLIRGESMLCHWEQDTEELRTCLQNLEGRSVEAVGHRGPDPGVWLRFAEGLVLDLLPYPDDVSVLATLSTRGEYVEMTDEGTIKRTERRGYRPLTEEEVSPPSLK